MDINKLLESKRVEVKIAETKVDRFFVKQFREDHHLTQIALANILGVTKKTIEKWEQGVNNVNGSSAVLLKLLSDNPTLLEQIYSVKVVESKSNYSGGFDFRSYGDGTCELTDIGSCEDININIPLISPKGDKIIRIGRSAFEHCTSLTSITIPSSVTSIGAFAFMGCNSLCHVSIGDRVEIIEYGAFIDCTSLTTIAIPEGVRSIENAVFRDCTYLAHVYVPDSVTSIEKQAFFNCKSLTNITIPHSLINIGPHAFFLNKQLQSRVGNYKAFFGDGQKLYAVHRNVKYKLHEKKTCRGELILCKNGLHYCTNMFDIFNYYSGEYGRDFVIAECEVSEENIGNDTDSKRCARWIKPTKLLTRQEIIDILNNKQ